jgi:hypothetical protein
MFGNQCWPWNMEGFIFSHFFPFSMKLVPIFLFTKNKKGMNFLFPMLKCANQMRLKKNVYENSKKVAGIIFFFVKGRLMK